MNLLHLPDLSTQKVKTVENTAKQASNKTRQQADKPMHHTDEALRNAYKNK